MSTGMLLGCFLGTRVQTETMTPQPTKRYQKPLGPEPHGDCLPQRAYLMDLELVQARSSNLSERLMRSHGERGRDGRATLQSTVRLLRVALMRSSWVIGTGVWKDTTMRRQT